MFRDNDTFIAASTEQGFKRNLSNPSSLSSNGNSASPPQKTRLQKSRKKPREESSGIHMWGQNASEGVLLTVSLNLYDVKLISVLDENFRIV